MRLDGLQIQCREDPDEWDKAAACLMASRNHAGTQGCLNEADERSLELAKQKAGK